MTKNSFYNGKEITKKNFLTIIQKCMEEGWRNSHLQKSTEEGLEKIYHGGYEGREEDIEFIIEELNSKLTSGYKHPDANLQNVESIILEGNWFFFQELQGKEVGLDD